MAGKNGSDRAVSPAVEIRKNSLAQAVTAYGSLFVSFSTLFCCALPALLVLLGFSLTGVLTFFTAIPGWQQVGSYDMWLFGGSALLLLVGFYLAYFVQGAPGDVKCELPQGSGGSACSIAVLWNRRILWLAFFLLLLAAAMNFWGIDWMKAHGYFNHQTG